MYQYVLVPFVQLRGLLTYFLKSGDIRDAYTSKDSIAADWQKLLDAGYRWVRTDNDCAVMERWIADPLPEDINAELEMAELKDRFPGISVDAVNVIERRLTIVTDD